MKTKVQNHTPFNSSLEVGLRSLVILTSIYPLALDLQKLLYFDYLIVHSGDIQGPESLHPPLPLRSGELLVRRELIDQGLLLMISRGLICRKLSSENGFQYLADEKAAPFLDSVASPYLLKLRERGKWVSENFSKKTESELSTLMRKFMDRWTYEFQGSEGVSQ